MVAAEGVRRDLLAAGVDMGEEATTEEGMTADMHPEADIVEDIEVDLEATLHTERCWTVMGFIVIQASRRTQASAGSPVQM